MIPLFCSVQPIFFIVHIDTCIFVNKKTAMAGYAFSSCNPSPGFVFLFHLQGDTIFEVLLRNGRQSNGWGVIPEGARPLRNAPDAAAAEAGANEAREGGARRFEI